jgi:hypothetical protein
MREICNSASMSGMCKRSQGPAHRAPPTESDGNSDAQTCRRRATSRHDRQRQGWLGRFGASRCHNLDGHERRLTDSAFVTAARHEAERLAILADASHLHYIVCVKTSTLPAVRVEPALRSDAEAVLDEGESLSDFVASCVRGGVAWRRTQDAFLARARDAVERSEREDNGISPQEVLRQMDVRLEAARRRLAASKASAGR